MSLVIEGEHLHRLCLMCNPIGYCIYEFIRTHTPHTPSPKPRMFNVYVESAWVLVTFKLGNHMTVKCK